MKNIKYFVVGMLSGMVVLKSIEMTMENNEMSCKKVTKNLEKEAKKKMGCLNSKVQSFDFEQWKQQTVNQLKTWLGKIENLSEDMISDKKQVKDLFKQVKDDNSFCCNCNCDD